MKARLEPFQDVVARNEANPKQCNWLQSLSSSNEKTVQKLLASLKPAPPLSEIIDLTLTNLDGRVNPVTKQPLSFWETVQNSLAKFAADDGPSRHSRNLSNGICLHHRDGLDWHEHCVQWEGIPDGVWRKNCLNDRQLPLHELVKNRIPTSDTKSWIYYIGDEEPSDQMTGEFKDIGINLIHRKKDALLSNERIGSAMHVNNIATETHRDLFSVIDFFVCSEIESFIGNSVSTFSANQIARRNGMKSTWYNSRSIPLAEMFPVFNIPIVYTYTEESQKLGQNYLKASILSVRGVFGMLTDIHVLYHGSKDKLFLKWLEENNVIIHNHEPIWLETVEKMRLKGDPQSSHLFLHKGNYIGTWQRIDIPLFINAEYCLLLDSDTIVHSTFGMHSFGLDVTPGIAVSAEMWEDSNEPSNLGVALMNVPTLRETHEEFLKYIYANKEPVFKSGLSDQGAYLHFYAESTRFLAKTFNIKPYWLQKHHFDNRTIVHFHGMKPHDILKLAMGYPRDSFPSALSFLIDQMVHKTDEADICITMQDFGKSIVKDVENLNEYCNEVFGNDERYLADVCIEFFTELAGTKESVDLCTQQFLFPIMDKREKERVGGKKRELPKPTMSEAS